MWNDECTEEVEGLLRVRQRKQWAKAGMFDRAVSAETPSSPVLNQAGEQALQRMSQPTECIEALTRMSGL